MIDWIKSIIQTIGYPGITILMVIENFFPPIPSEVIMPFAGFISEEGNLDFWGIILAGTLGSILGTIPYYYIGFKIGESRLEQWVDRYGHWLMLKNRDIERAQTWFDRHNTAAVLLGRMVPGIRTLISIPAGIKRMNFFAFILLSLLGTAIWVSLLTFLGRNLEQNYDKVEALFGPMSYLVIGGLILAYIIYVIRQRLIH